MRLGVNLFVVQSAKLRLDISRLENGWLGSLPRPDSAVQTHGNATLASSAAKQLPATVGKSKALRRRSAEV